MADIVVQDIQNERKHKAKQEAELLIQNNSDNSLIKDLIQSEIPPIKKTINQIALNQSRGESNSIQTNSSLSAKQKSQGGSLKNSDKNSSTSTRHPLNNQEDARGAKLERGKKEIQGEEDLPQRNSESTPQLKKQRNQMTSNSLSRRVTTQTLSPSSSTHSPPPPKPISKRFYRSGKPKLNNSK
jgi:hypothetical protein